MAAGPVLLFIIVAAVAAKPRPVAAEPVLFFIIVAAVAAESVAVAAESVAAVAVALLSDIRPYDRRPSTAPVDSRRRAGNGEFASELPQYIRVGEGGMASFC